MRKSLLAFSLSLILIAGYGCGGGLSTRVAKAVGAIPSIVRVLFPQADQRILEAVDAAGQAFKEFADNKSGTAWDKAENAWNVAKPLLARLGNERIQQIIAVIDLLIGQVSVPTTPMGEAVSDKIVVQFNPADVKRLEELVK